MKKFVFVLVIWGIGCSLNAQSNLRIKNHNLIFNAEIESGSLYTFAASSVITGLANYYLLNDAFFENSFAYNLYTTNVDDLKVRTMNPMGLTARNLFNNLQVGLKLGYQTYSPEFFNCGIYASAHYKVNQFEMGYNDDDMNRHRAQRALIGATALLSLGSMEQPSRVIIEAGVRYSLAAESNSKCNITKYF